jgi:hypothetical protein
VLIGIGVSGALILVVRFLTPHAKVVEGESDEEGSTRKELLDRIATLVGGVFAFVLGLVIVTNLQTMNTAQANTISEANGLGQMYTSAGVLPQPEHTRLRQTIHNYAETVIHTEWSLMGVHQMSAKANALFGSIRNQVLDFPTDTKREATMQSAAVSGYWTAQAGRRTRALQAGLGLPTFLWGLLIGDGVVLLCVPLMKGFKPTKRNTVHFMAFGVMIALSLWFVYELNYPFSGGLTVQPSAFTNFVQLNLSGSPSQ